MTEWIFPSNSKMFRVDDCFRENLFAEWYQPRSLVNLQKGDIAYIYVSSPVQEIHWKCLVETVMQNPEFDDSKYNVVYDSEYVPQGPVARLRVIYEYDIPELLSYKKLKENGLTTKLMGPCHVKPELAVYLSSVNKIQENADEKENYLKSLSLEQLEKLARKHSKKRQERKVSSSVSYVRNVHVAEYAKARANGICQLCGRQAPFIDKNGYPYLESHHVQWLSKGGDDSVNNTVALCPNCHRRVHRLDDPSDLKQLEKVLANYA